MDPRSRRSRSSSLPSSSPGCVEQWLVCCGLCIFIDLSFALPVEC
jgi:hypothetical protein